MCEQKPPCYGRLFIQNVLILSLSVFLDIFNAAKISERGFGFLPLFQNINWVSKAASF